MKTLLHLFFKTSIFSILLFSCANDNTLDNVEITAKYFPLAIGNYWEFEVEAFNSQTHTGFIRPDPDIFEVVDYMGINGILYYQVDIQHWYGEIETVFLRDSSGYIIDDQHIIWFSAIDRNSVLEKIDLYDLDGFFVEYSVPDSFVYVFIPLGEFKCLNFQGCAWANGTLLEKKIHNYYAPGVGPVYQRFFSVSTGNSSETRRRLVDYRIIE